MASVTEDHETARGGGEAGPIDVELISAITGKALALRLTTSTREEILANVEGLHRSLVLLVGADLGDSSNIVALAQLRRAETFVDAYAMPTDTTPAFRAYSWTREAASLTRRLLGLWTEQNGTEHP